MKIIIYVLCFNDTSETKARRDFGMYTWARILRIETTMWLENIMYESWLMAHEAEWAACDFVGTIAYSIFSKVSKFSINSLMQLIQKSDIFAFMKRSGNLIENANGPHFRTLWIDMLTRLGYTEAEAVDPTVEPFYCNYWIARPAIMREYCAFYQRALRALEASELQAELWSDTGYANSNYSNADWCRRTFGVPHYTHHVFLMERLPCIFAHKRYRVETIPTMGYAANEKILYLVMFDPATDGPNKDAIAAYAGMFPSVQPMFICAGPVTERTGDILTVQSSSSIGTLIGAIAVIDSARLANQLNFDYVVCSDASIALDFSNMPSWGGAHYSGPILNDFYIWGGCTVLSRDALTILLMKGIDNTISPDIAIGNILSKFVLPFRNGSVDRVGALRTGAFCYVPSEECTLAPLIAQFDRPAICAASSIASSNASSIGASSICTIAAEVVRNLFASALASMGDLSAAYTGSETLDRLGLPPYYGDQWAPTAPVAASEDMALRWLGGAAPLPAVINMRDCKFHSRESRAWLKSHVREREYDVRAANPFRARYGNNCDVFIYANAYDSIKKALMDMPDPFTGFVVSCEPSLASRLLAEFPSLIAWDSSDTVRTLQFASTCGTIVLANDEFSWLLEALAFDTKILP